jgi:endonuclease/exonuclease/phosphatase family metal-dependent hydrolase
MQLKLLTLNLWRYYDFENRFENTITEISRLQPDVIFLQEVQIDETLSPFSQVELLKEKLNAYKYSIHSNIYPKTSQRGVNLEIPVQHGMAVLSKYPIINSFEYYLKQSEKEKELRSNLCFDINLNEQIIKLANIHFGNKEEWAKKQIQQFTNYLKNRNETRIMAGDFNMYGLENYKNLYPEYLSSIEFKKYISFPEKNWCLDYFLIPKTMKFVEIDVIEKYLSDQKGIFGVVEI